MRLPFGVLWVLAQQNAADAKLNLCGTSYSLSLVGAPVFTSYKGFNGFTSVIYFDTGFNPITATTPNYTRNSANLGAWSYTVAADNGGQIGNDISDLGLFNNYGGTFYVKLNGAGVVMQLQAQKDCSLEIGITQPIPRHFGMG